jgi:hypothetical protein
MGFPSGRKRDRALHCAEGLDEGEAEGCARAFDVPPPAKPLVDEGQTGAADLQPASAPTDLRARLLMARAYEIRGHATLAAGTINRLPHGIHKRFILLRYRQ